MGYCGACEHLTSRHNCSKYHKGLAYSRFGSKSLTCSSHERCSECEKDYRIAELQEMLNQKWKSVETATPDDGQEILASDGKYVYMVEYDADLDAPFGDMDGIAAWMPLPEPYRPD